MRGMRVIVPVDGISSEPAYPEQYTAWHLTNAPGVGARTTLRGSLDYVLGPILVLMNRLRSPKCASPG